MPQGFVRAKVGGVSAWRGEIGEGVPLLVACDGTFYQEYSGLAARQYFSDPEVMLNAQLKVWERFYGLPHLSPSFYPGVEASALGCEVSWVRDGVGAPWVRPAVQSLADVRALRTPDPSRDGLMPQVLSYAEHFWKRCFHREEVVIDLYDGMGPFDIACLLRGTEGAFTDVHSNPQLLHRLLEVATQTCIKWVEALESKFGPAEVIASSSDYGAFLGPEEFEKFVVPYTRAVYDAFPGRTKVFHSDGDFSPHTLPFLKKLGLDVFYLFSPKLDIARVREVLGGEVCLVGNVDPLLLVQGSPGEVEERARACIEGVGTKGGFVLSAGGWLGAGTRPENVDALIKAALGYGRA